MEKVTFAQLLREKNAGTSKNYTVKQLLPVVFYLRDGGFSTAEIASVFNTLGLPGTANSLSVAISQYNKQ